MILGVQVTENRILSKARIVHCRGRACLLGEGLGRIRGWDSRSVMGPNKKLENESGAQRKASHSVLG